MHSKPTTSQSPWSSHRTDICDCKGRKTLPSGQGRADLPKLLSHAVGLWTKSLPAHAHSMSPTCTVCWVDLTVLLLGCMWLFPFLEAGEGEGLSMHQPMWAAVQCFSGVWSTQTHLFVSFSAKARMPATQEPPRQLICWDIWFSLVIVAIIQWVPRLAIVQWVHRLSFSWNDTVSAVAILQCLPYNGCNANHSGYATVGAVVIP